MSFELKEGNRYLWKTSQGDIIWQIVSDNSVKVISSSHDDYPEGAIYNYHNDDWRPRKESDEYLGNFGKDSNFNILYDLLNQ